MCRTVEIGVVGAAIQGSTSLFARGAREHAKGLVITPCHCRFFLLSACVSRDLELMFDTHLTID